MRTRAPAPPSPGTPPAASGPGRLVRSVLSGRRLLVGLLAVLVVPALMGAAALSYAPAEPPPTATAPPHPPLPQVPDGVARAQLERSAQAVRLARKLTVPTLLEPAATGPGGTRGLATLALAPRATPYTLAELRRSVPAAFSRVAATGGADPAGPVLVTANIDVPTGASLVVDEQTPDVRLSSAPGAFASIISRGTLTVSGDDDAQVRISSWDPGRRAPDPGGPDGRSFVLQIGGRMDVHHGRFSHLGFGTGTTSGVAWRGAAADTGSSERVKAQGAVISSVFEHNHFGAYTHEAEGMVWENNAFVANTEYGFDPHDFSNGFVVVNNTARHNGKHGFIFSRGCDDNLLRGNTAYANQGHGFMIDDGRSTGTATAERRIDTSDDNVLIDNLAYANTHSGVEIEGGRDNVVSGNRLIGNDIGVRVKDRASVAVRDNAIVDSARYGVHVLDTGGRVPLTGNSISGSWAAVNLASGGGAVVGANSITDVSTPLVVAGVAQRDPSWLDRVGRFLTWNPVLVLWGLILGVPLLVGVLRTVQAPFRAHRRRVGAA